MIASGRPVRVSSKIERDAAGYTITDKGSITGTYVNEKPVESARLAKGDVIEIGDLHLEVQAPPPGPAAVPPRDLDRDAGQERNL